VTPSEQSASLGSTLASPGTASSTNNSIDFLAAPVAGIPSWLGSTYHIGVIDESATRHRCEALALVLDERGLRRLAAAKAIAEGRGGVSAVVRATGLTRSTIGCGLGELRAGRMQDVDRVRRPGMRTQAAERDGCEPAQ